MTTHRDDLPVLHAHQLADGLVQLATSVVGRGMHDGDEILRAHRQIEELGAEGAPAEGTLPSKEVLPDRGPSAVRPRKETGPREVPDGILVEAALDRGQVS